MQYQNFRISDEASGYRMYFNQTTNDTYLLGDCFSALYGAQFSAYDNDNDEDGGVNCAQNHEGGWWFRGGACSTCNPTGPLLQPAGGRRTGVDAEIFWTEDLDDLVPFKMTMFLTSL
ncbi:hypothetical protein V1264_012599 [Littorina saxatilis]|uniref:Fibrinogen C-terminal domain-containing protein n=2 Tax=Littorina saxatilis TaxID=31220 RepID=A0AAN9BWU1_9CAEN